MWTFKSKLQIIHAATYIALFLPEYNKCFFSGTKPHIHICFYYFLNLCSYFHLLFLTLIATRHILQFSMFDSISEIIKKHFIVDDERKSVALIMTKANTLI